MSNFIIFTQGPSIVDWISALAPAITILFSIIGYFIKRKIDLKNEISENYRTIEVNITMNLENLYRIREELKSFKVRISEVSDDTKNMTGSKNFSLNYTNFPAIIEISRNEDLPKLKTNSYYLHNKIIWADRHLKQFDSMLVGLEKAFTELNQRNETVLRLVREDGVDAIQQRSQYAENLDSFALLIEESFIKSCDNIIRLLMQIKIYNHKIRQKGKGFIRECEKVKRKTPLDIPSEIDRIDNLINDEVVSRMREAESRAKSQ
mgnify:FL=1